MTDLLKAIELLNSLLSIGVTALPIAQRVGQVIESAQREQREITADEWRDIAIEMSKADSRLNEAIENAPD